MKTISAASVGLVWLAVVGCDNTSDGVGLPESSGLGGHGGAGRTDAGRAGSAGTRPDRCGPIDPALATRNATDLFDYPHVPVFDLYLPEDDWAELRVNARDEEYVEAQACFEGSSIGRVGLRFKGSYGSLYGCFDEQDEMICRKLSMKLKFSEYDPDLRFYGLKRLNFNAYHYDDTRMHERLAYDLFRQMGIVAPRASWAVVRVNDESYGLFGMVEQVDGRFLEDRWPDNPDGNLYKEVWPVQTDVDWITSRLKTNEETADVSAFIAFAEAMNAAGADELRSTLGSYTDTEYLARFLAVEDAIASYDGITAYYTNEDLTVFGNHNFYFYEASADQFVIIPWDLDGTFWVNPDHGTPHWTEVPADCSLTYEIWDAYAVIAPQCDAVFRALGEDLRDWRAAAQELLDGPFAEETMFATINDHMEFIRAEAYVDPTPSTYGDFAGAVDYLRGQVRQLRERLQRLLAGQPWAPLRIDTGEVLGFELQDDYTLTTEGTWMYRSPSSTVSVEINTVDPMSGAQDLRLGFQYANGDEPYQQWCSYGMPLAGGANDLTSFTGIRLWVRADQPRVVRLDLDSPESTEARHRIRFGWDVPATEVATEVEVLFSDAALAGWVIADGLDPGDDLQSVLAAVTALVIEPQCVGRDDTGQLPDGTTDEGFVHVDDIEFF